MPHVFNTFCIALTNNFDNVGVSIAHSIRGIRISKLINLWISIITFVITFFSAYSGTVLLGFISKHLSSLIAMMVLAAIGLWMIIVPFLKKDNDCPDESVQENKRSAIHVLLNPQDADIDNSKHIDFKEATFLGIALSSNNVGGGVSAGMIGLSSFWVGFLSAAFSFIAFWTANYVATYFIKWNIAKKTPVVAGLILIAIGIEQII